MNKQNLSGKKLLVVMSNADPEKPQSCYAPMFQATVAAALSHDVEVILTGISVELAILGRAQEIEIDHDIHSTLYDLIKEAHQAGVAFKACNTSITVAAAELIDEVEERVGAAYVVAEAMDENTVTFTY